MGLLTLTDAATGNGVSTAIPAEGFMREEWSKKADFSLACVDEGRNGAL